MNVWRPALLALLLGACGGEAPSVLPLDLELNVQALEAGDVLQFVMLHQSDRTGAQVTCESATVTCVRDQTSQLRLLRLDVEGSERLAYRVPLDLEAARTLSGQALRIPGIPPGGPYLLVVEAVRSSGGFEERVGVGCAPVTRIEAGDNAALTVQVADTADRCNPAF